MKRRITKKVASHIPRVNKLLQEKDRLSDLAKQQKQEIIELSKQKNNIEKQLEREIDRRTNPTLSQDYKFATDPLFQITKEDLEKSKAVNKEGKIAINTANWLIPNFEHITFGGIHTIFRFIEKLSRENVENRIIIYNNPDFDKARLESQIKDNFPGLKGYEIIAKDLRKEKPETLPESDIAFCTLWDSAYILLRFNKTKRKYYFIQDYEALFFPAGSISALVESTYRFGFTGIVNTPGLLEEVRSRHNMKATSFIPGVNKKIYYPSPKKINNKKLKIFFYGRPTKDRNAFNLGIETIRKLLDKYENKIEIITAGAEWDESVYGLKGGITNLGLIKTIDEVAALYRQCDIGFCFMLTRHPSYQPIEFMASGVATVTNTNESNFWLLKNKENCLISEPSPISMAEAIGELVEDDSLRNKLIKNGLATVSKMSWDKPLDQIWETINEKN